MLIQKTFHLPFPLKTAKAKLTDFSAYRRECVGIEEGEVDPKSAEGFFRFRLRGGFKGCVELVMVDGEIETQTLFRSSQGNVIVLGMLEYFPVEADRTEVVMTLDYVIRSPWHRCVERLVGGVNRLLNRNLAVLEAYFARPAAGFRADTNLARPINGKTPH